MNKKTSGSTANSEGNEKEILQYSWNRGRVALAGGSGIILLILILSLVSCEPPKGSILYGICNVFLEQNIAYPETIRRVFVEQYPRATRINFTSIDAFGQYKMEMIECSFVKNKTGNLIIDKVLFNRREMDSEKIKKFNVSIPAIIASEPDLTLPSPRRNILEGIR